MRCYVGRQEDGRVLSSLTFFFPRTNVRCDRLTALFVDPCSMVGAATVEVWKNAHIFSSAAASAEMGCTAWEAMLDMGSVLAWCRSFKGGLVLLFSCLSFFWCGTGSASVSVRTTFAAQFSRVVWLFFFERFFFLGRTKIRVWCGVAIATFAVTVHRSTSSLMVNPLRPCCAACGPSRCRKLNDPTPQVFAWKPMFSKNVPCRRCV